MSVLEASSQAVDSKVILRETAGEHFDHLYKGSWKGDTSDSGVLKQLECRGDHTDFLVWPSISLSVK